MTHIRIAVVGDALVAGVGDPKALGWVGRVGARTPRAEGPVTMFPLGVPGETTSGLLGRWREETARRFGDRQDECRLVVGLGHADAAAGVTLARTRLHLADVLDEAQRAGRARVRGRSAAERQRGAELHPGRADHDAYADVCVRRRVTYVDTFGPLVNHEDWLTDLAAGDGVHPGQAGYGLIAWLVLHGGWHDWLGLPQA